MRPPLTFMLASMLALLVGCATNRAPFGQAAPAQLAEEEPLSRGETIYLVSHALDGNSLGFPSATVDPAGDVQLFLGVKVHVAGLTPAQANEALKKAYQPICFGSWNFIVTRVQPDASGGGAAKRSGVSKVSPGPP